MQLGCTCETSLSICLFMSSYHIIGEDTVIINQQGDTREMKLFANILVPCCCVCFSTKSSGGWVAISLLTSGNIIVTLFQNTHFTVLQCS